MDKVSWEITTITNTEDDPEGRHKVYSDTKSDRPTLFRMRPMCLWEQRDRSCEVDRRGKPHSGCRQNSVLEGAVGEVISYKRNVKQLRYAPITGSMQFLVALFDQIETDLRRGYLKLPSIALDNHAPGWQHCQTLRADALKVGNSRGMGNTVCFWSGVCSGTGTV